MMSVGFIGLVILGGILAVGAAAVFLAVYLLLKKNH